MLALTGVYWHFVIDMKKSAGFWNHCVNFTGVRTKAFNDEAEPVSCRHLVRCDFMQHQQCGAVRVSGVEKCFEKFKITDERGVWLGATCGCNPSRITLLLLLVSLLHDTMVRLLSHSSGGFAPNASARQDNRWWLHSGKTWKRVCFKQYSARTRPRQNWVGFTLHFATLFPKFAQQAHLWVSLLP